MYNFTILGRQIKSTHSQTCFSETSNLFVKPATQSKHFLHIVIPENPGCDSWRRKLLLQIQVMTLEPKCRIKSFLQICFNLCLQVSNITKFCTYSISAPLPCVFCVFFYVLFVLKFYHILLSFMYFLNWHLCLFYWDDE